MPGALPASPRAVYHLGLGLHATTKKAAESAAGPLQARVLAVSRFDARRLHDAVCRACESYESVQPRAARHRTLALEAMQTIGMRGVGAVFTISINSEALASPVTQTWFGTHAARMRDGDWPRLVAPANPVAIGRLVGALVHRWVSMPVEESCVTMGSAAASASSASDGDSGPWHLPVAHRPTVAVVTFTFGDAAWLQHIQGLAEGQAQAQATAPSIPSISWLGSSAGGR